MDIRIESVVNLLSRALPWRGEESGGHPHAAPGFYILSLSECSGNATRLSGFLVLENGTVVSSEEKRILEEIRPLSEKLMLKILGPQIGRELLTLRRPVPLSEGQMAQIKRGNYHLIQSRFGRDYQKFINAGEYENRDLLVCDTITGQWPGVAAGELSSQYTMRVYSGYLSLVFLTWNYTYFKAEYNDGPVRQASAHPGQPQNQASSGSHGSTPRSTSTAAAPRPTSWHKGA